MDAVPHIGQQQVGHPSGIDGGAEDHQIPFAEGFGFLPDGGGGKVEGLQLCAGLLGQTLGDPGDDLLGGVGGAEVSGPHSIDFHGKNPFLLLCCLYYNGNPEKVNGLTEDGEKSVFSRKKVW